MAYIEILDVYVSFSVHCVYSSCGSQNKHRQFSWTLHKQVDFRSRDTVWSLGDTKLIICVFCKMCMK